MAVHGSDAGIGESYSSSGLTPNVILPVYEAEVTVWKDVKEAHRVYHMTVMGSAKAVTETIQSAMDAFREDQER